MFADIVESLMGGSSEYPTAFVSAKAFWDEFFQDHSGDDLPTLQTAIEKAQLPFQWRLEKVAGMNAPDAKSIMALTAIGSLYNDGFEDTNLAQRVIEAFSNSTNLSGGAKNVAKYVAREYGLKEVPIRY